MTGSARRAMRLAVMALALGAGGAATASAQGALLGPGAAFLSAGASRLAIGALDDRLAARGYPTFGRTAFAVSLGAYRTLRGGVMLGGEWHGLIMGEEEHPGGGEVGLGGGYGTLGVGYAVPLSPRARAYPRLGIGVGGLGVWVDREDESVGFDEVLADPRPTPLLRESVLSRDGLVVDLGAGLELFPRGGGRGPLIGLRAGYLAAPFDSDWDNRERTATGGPDATIAGPYVRVVVGAGWSR